MPAQSSSLTQYTAPFVDGLRIESTRDAAAVAGPSVATRIERRSVGTSTLPVVAAILREAGIPLSVRQLVERAGAKLPTRSKTPLTVVARDLAMDIKKKGDASAYVRTSPGRYTLRALVLENRNTADTSAPRAATEQNPHSLHAQDRACIDPRI